MTELDSSDVVLVRLDFSYDGTAYRGWAEQPRLKTVQGELHAALARILAGAPVSRVTVAGRTDAGVHARGQVGHFTVSRQAWEAVPGRSSRPPADSLKHRLNGVLPGDIVISELAIAPPGFDARFSALERKYAYRLSDSPATRDPLTRRHVYWHSKAVDVDVLNEASATVTGLRDFTPFCRPREGATTVRDLVEFSWLRPDQGPDTGLVVATIRADAFCHSMVRSLVGALLAVGQGRRELPWLAAVAASIERSPAIKVAPPHGLTLEAVAYPAPELMGERAILTRDRRTLD